MTAIKATERMQVYVAVQEYSGSDRPSNAGWPMPLELSGECRYQLEEIRLNHDALLWAFRHVDELSDEPTRVITLEEFVAEAQAEYPGRPGFFCWFKQDERSSV